VRALICPEGRGEGGGGGGEATRVGVCVGVHPARGVQGFSRVFKIYFGENCLFCFHLGAKPSPCPYQALPCPFQAPARPLPGPFQAPSRPLPGPFQAPSRPLPGPFQAPSRPLPGPFQAPARPLPGPCQKKSSAQPPEPRAHLHVLAGLAHRPGRQQYVRVPRDVRRGVLPGVRMGQGHGVAGPGHGGSVAAEVRHGPPASHRSLAAGQPLAIGQDSYRIAIG
jgi:hypothetical protein